MNYITNLCTYFKGKSIIIKTVNMLLRNNIGPFTEKALLPYVLSLYHGTMISLLEEEHKDMVSSYFAIISDM